MFRMVLILNLNNAYFSAIRPHRPVAVRVLSRTVACRTTRGCDRRGGKLLVATPGLFSGRFNMSAHGDRSGFHRSREEKQSRRAI